MVWGDSESPDPTPLPLDSPLSCGNRYAIREGVDTEGQQVHWFKAILRPVS